MADHKIEDYFKYCKVCSNYNTKESTRSKAKEEGIDVTGCGNGSFTDEKKSQIYI